MAAEMGLVERLRDEGGGAATRVAGRRGGSGWREWHSGVRAGLVERLRDGGGGASGAGGDGGRAATGWWAQQPGRVAGMAERDGGAVELRG
ncbi:hypothetical protein [Flindersiella endophytica]